MNNNQQFASRHRRQAHKTEDVYLFVVRYKRQHDGNSPSVREIGRACHLPSTSHVHYYLVRLEVEGRIRMLGTRSIEVVGGRWTSPPTSPPTPPLKGRGEESV